jgi:hypothetical protein
MMREKGAEPQAYPAEKARGVEIIVRRAWQRVLFVLGSPCQSSRCWRC